MEQPTQWKVVLPAALKGRIFEVAQDLNIPAACALRLALTEFVKKHEQSK